jgi:hypothetical protein
MARASRIFTGMSHLLLVMVLAVSAVACGNKDDAAAVQPAAGESAGKVLEVEGKVTVRGKQLAVGDALKADDPIETGADGRVVVELSHNLARWELGPNKSQKVNESIAWKLPRNDGNSTVVIQDMSAAGRPAERNAADTAASAPAPAAAAPAAEPAPAPSPPPPPPAPAAQPAPGGGAAKGASRAPAAAAAPVMPPPKPEAKADKLAQPAEEKEPVVRGGPKKSAESLIEAKEPALRACLGPGDVVKIHVEVDTSGKPTTTIDGASSAKVSTCLKAVIAKLSLPAAKASVNVTIENSNR